MAMLSIRPVCLLLTAISLTGGVLAQTTPDMAREFAALSRNPDATGQQWFSLAGEAREAEALGIATDALGKAEEAGFAPVRIGLERARILVLQQKPDAAVAELREVADAGFTSVAFLTGDPLINSLAGRDDYDSIVEAMSIQAYPCAHKDGFGDFDFWIGEWDVHVASGAQAGSNVIRKAERGCVLIENWTNTSGGTGMSINYLDLTTNEWVQIWNAEGGSQINIRGGLTDDGMRMEGHIHYVGNGTTAPFRALWTPLPDGRVRQFFEQSNDGGKTWTPWFEGFYSRRNPQGSE